MNIPIVIAAYNRDHTLGRLLSSLANAHYDRPVTLIISIDGGGPDSVKAIADDFKWEFGPKEVLAQAENMGLRRHILSCGHLATEYDGIILLEDDLFVSPWFYQYTLAALEFYRNSPSISGISLYSYRYNETAYLPFTPLNDGADAYFMQLPCSWGQAWLKEHWEAFEAWYQVHADSDFSDDPRLPANIAQWPATSWKKYFAKYLIDADKYFVYPRDSYTTNFGDKGQHHHGTNLFQVPLVYENQREFAFRRFEESCIKYDVFCELLPHSLVRLSGRLDQYDLTVDLYGSKSVQNIRSDYLLTVNPCSSYVEAFGRTMLPAEMNVIHGISGNQIFLTRTSEMHPVEDIDNMLRLKAANIEEQKYYYSTDDMHYSDLYALRSRFHQLEDAYQSLDNDYQRVKNNGLDCVSRLQRLESSLSWRLTAPLRKILDALRR